MKRIITFIITLLLIPNLSGCGMSLLYRDVEQLMVVQTMGLDADENGVLLSMGVAADMSNNKPAMCLSAEGRSVSTAIEHIKNYSIEEDVFCSHINYVLLGDEAARNGIDGILNYLCQSPEIRIDVPMYVVKNSTAQESMIGSGNENKGISEILRSVHSSLEYGGYSKDFTAAEIFRNIEHNGSSLICALEYAQSTDKEAEEDSKTVAINGYGIFKGYNLVSYINVEDSVAVGILMNNTGLFELTVKDMDGRTVTLEADNGSSKLKPIWSEDGSLRGIEIEASVSVSVLELDGKEADLSSEVYSDYLISQMEAEISKRISNVLKLSKKLKADFMNLGSSVEMSAPNHYRKAVPDFAELLPELQMRISVQGSLRHTNDIKDA